MLAVCSIHCYGLELRMSGPACDARPASAYVNDVDIPQNPKLAIVATQPGQHITWNAIQNWFGDQPGA